MQTHENINTPEALARCRANFIRQGGAGGPRRCFENGDGQVKYVWPAKMYYHALRNHGVHKDDKEYFRDMGKRMPECVVKYARKENMVGGGLGQPALPFSGRTQTAQHTMRARLAKGGKLQACLKAGRGPAGFVH